MPVLCQEVCVHLYIYLSFHVSISSTFHQGESWGSEELRHLNSVAELSAGGESRLYCWFWRGRTFLLASNWMSVCYGLCKPQVGVSTFISTLGFSLNTDNAIMRRSLQTFYWPEPHNGSPVEIVMILPWVFSQSTDDLSLFNHPFIFAHEAKWGLVGH
jgi:hypothetical protein